MATTLGVSDLLTQPPAVERPAASGDLSRRPSTTTSSRPQYLFIHTVRFWSMLAIVMMHGVTLSAKYANVSDLEVSLLTQVFKFGTIGFFLISGFLLGDRLQTSLPLSYLQRRASRLLPAWAVWFSALVLFFVVAHGFPRADGNASAAKALASQVFSTAIQCLIGTALWFIPNFMIALSCVVLLRRWLNDLRLGAVLLGINLFYAANVYLCWIPSRHTQAIFGFVFYLWLGAWCAQRKDVLERWVATLSAGRLAVCAVLAAGAGLLETRMLFAHHNIDPLNTLRLSNQVYSVVMTLILLRVRRRTWPRFIDVGEHTYGIYLTHTMVLTASFLVTARLFIGRGHHTGPVGFLAMWAFAAPLAYVLAFLLTRTLAASPWPWLVGATGAARKQAVHVSGELGTGRAAAVSATR